MGGLNVGEVVLNERTSPEAFPKRDRISRRRDYLHVYDAGRKEFARYVVVFSIANELGHPRIGITVTRKVGKANERNRLRRWVRETYRRIRDEVGLAGRGLDMVVNVKPGAGGATFQEFSEDLKRVLARVSSRTV